MVNKSQKELTRIWEQVPENYYERSIASNPLKKYWHTLKVITFKKLIGRKQPKTILDVGCASGRMANEISKVFPTSKITAVDVYQKAISFGKKHYPHIKFIKADAHKLPFKTNSFDLVICYEVIEHLVNPLKSLLEIKRVIKKDGHAIIAMDSGNITFRIVWWISEKTICRVWQNAHLHPYTHRELEAVIKQAGFKIVKKEFSHFGMEVSFLLKK